jgi:hypothetical protein
VGYIFPKGTSADIPETDKYQTLHPGEIDLPVFIVQTNTGSRLCEQQAYEPLETGKVVMDVGHWSFSLCSGF